MVAGFIMLVVWFFKFYRFITLIGESVMDGFCCGLAVVIGRSQLHPFYVGHGSDKARAEMMTPPYRAMMAAVVAIAAMV